MTITVKNLFGELVNVELGARETCEHGRLLPTAQDWTECLQCEEKWEESREQMRLLWLGRSEWTVIR